MQSPIDISIKNLEKRKTRLPLTWDNYSNVPKTMIIENSKHSVHGNGLWGRVTDTPSITNGPLENRYFFSQFHFHWGKDSSRGSEHTIDGKRYPLELHIVHDRETEPDDDLELDDSPTDLVVVSFMFEVSPTLNKMSSFSGL